MAQLRAEAEQIRIALAQVQPHHPGQPRTW
jgi:hypothetical protein